MKILRYSNLIRLVKNLILFSKYQSLVMTMVQMGVTIRATHLVRALMGLQNRCPLEFKWARSNETSTCQAKPHTTQLQQVIQGRTRRTESGQKRIHCRHRAWPWYQCQFAAALDP